MSSTPILPRASLSRDQTEQDVLHTMLVLLNQARFAFCSARSDAALWALVSRKKLDFSFADPDLGPVDLGLTFAEIADIEFVQAVMQMYDYGMLGLQDVSAASLDDAEGGASWASRTLYDLAQSTFLQEWVNNAGERYREAVGRCLVIAETANARLLLEGGKEGFFLEDREIGLLTFRQMSLLSGMTEQSLRTLVSRGAGLHTVKRESATYIEIADAKEWLHARGRYAPIRVVSDRGAAPLTQRRFASVEELQEAITHRAEYLAGELGQKAVAKRLRATGVEFKQQPLPDGTSLVTISEAELLEGDRMRRLGAALDLPEELFALRVAETVHSERLRKVEELLKGAKS